MKTTPERHILKKELFFFWCFTVCFVLPERKAQVLGGRERSRQVFVLQAFDNKFSQDSDMNAGGFCSSSAFRERKK